MCLDVAHRKPGSIEPDDLVIHSVDPGLALPDQLGLEAAVPVARHRQRHLAIRALHPLRRGAIAAVGLVGRRLGPGLIAQVRGQFGPKHPLHQPSLQLLHQPGIAEQILGPLAALQQLVQQLVGNRHHPCSSQEAWTGSIIHRRPDTLRSSTRHFHPSFLILYSCSRWLAMARAGPRVRFVAKIS